MSAARVVPSSLGLLTLLLGSVCLAAPGTIVLDDPVPTSGGAPPIEQTEHAVNVTIYEGFSVTRAEQTFVNTSERDLEGAYAFPLPRGATVAGVTVWIDGRELVGQVVERPRARQIYEAQRRAGRDAGLVERDGFTRFTVRVGRVPARGSAKVRLEYYQTVEIDHGVGRYVYPLADGNTDRARAVFTGHGPQRKVRFEVALHSSVPLAEVATPGWQGGRLLQLEARPHGRRVLLEVQEATLDRDFVLYWRLEGEQAAKLTVLANATEPGVGGHFLLTLTPGVELAAIAGGRDWIFLLDVSGSMRGEKLEAAVEACAELIGALSPDDRLRLIAFNGAAREVVTTTSATPTARVQASSALRALEANGGTNLHEGLELALGGLDPERAAGIVLLTDGVANVGPTRQRELLALLQRRDARVFAFELGNGANQPLLDRLAEVSGGFHMDVSTADLVSGRMLLAKDKLARQALRELSVEVTSIEGQAAGESSGAEVEAFAFAPGRPSTVYSGDRLVLLGRYRGHGRATVTARGVRDGERVRWTAEVDLPAQEQPAPELERLWARARIAEVEAALAEGGPSPALEQEALQLALDAQLVTERTALIALTDADAARYQVGRSGAEKLARERAAQVDAVRAPQQPGTTVQQQAPARVATARDRSRYAGPGAYRSSGGSSGGGAFGPLGALLSAALAATAARRRRRAA